ncbi:MAG: SAM-dependent methyltransferase, FkbM family [Verrucomicrobia bacterium]|nr:SAM-dependent methyltransferase, FkbM family [Verrucomicrobiota bacterium]
MADSIKARLRHAANRLLHPLGLHLSRADRAFEMDGLLARAAARGAKVGTWIDVGASDGSWSLRARRHFPQSRYLLFEPLRERQRELAAMREQHGFEHIAAVAGARAGTVEFAVDPLLDGSGVAAPGTAGTRSMPVESIDDVLAARGLPAPYGIKLDTHGYELPVLEGAAHTLPQASLVVIEAYNFTLTPGSLRFHELCAWLEARNFRCIDLADPMRRPRDGALWQMDLAFVPSDSPLFDSNEY